MKILVVDDHELIRKGLAQALQVLDDKLTILEAGNSPQALQLAEENSDIDLVLLDLNLPGRTGIEALAEFREHHPALPVVVLSGNESADAVVQAIDAGAMGYIPKTANIRLLQNALKLVLSGGVYLPADVLNQQRADTLQARDAARSYHDLGLTPRQGDVLALLVEGKPNKLICRELDLAEGTVKIHISAILKALDVANRTQAVIAVSRMGLNVASLRSARKPN